MGLVWFGSLAGQRVVAESVVHAVAIEASSPTSDAGTPAVHAVSYTTGSRGSKLKWVPHRAPVKKQPVHVANRIVSHQVTVPDRSEAGGSDPFQDPFGDSRPKPQPAPPMQIFNGDQRQAETAQPAPRDTSTEEAPETQGQEESAGPAGQGAIPLLDEFTMAPQREADGCPSPEELKPISDITDDITAEEGEFPRECPLADDPFMPRAWAPTTFAWKASGLCHKPLYFEDVQLERYGHSWGPYVQPVVSGGHFFLTVPALPYFMTLCPPYECVYTLGYYRPGNCAPHMLDPLPLSVRSGVVEAAAWTGAVFLIP